jgi:hypothetical protein
MKDKYTNDTANYNAKELGLGSGIVRERAVKDVFCLFIYIAFLGAMVYCASYGNKNGQLDKLLAPLDGNDKFCGIGAEMKEYPRLYITDLSSTSFKKAFASAVCVEKCP